MTTHHQLQTDASANASHTVERTYFTIFFIFFSFETRNRLHSTRGGVLKYRIKYVTSKRQWKRAQLMVKMAFCILHDAVYICRRFSCIEMYFPRPQPSTVTPVVRVFILSIEISTGIYCVAFAWRRYSDVFRKWCEGLVVHVFGPPSKQYQQELILENLEKFAVESVEQKAEVE